MGRYPVRVDKLMEDVCTPVQVSGMDAVVYNVSMAYMKQILLQINTESYTWWYKIRMHGRLYETYKQAGG